MFVKFIKSLEDVSSWKYSGESELLLVDYQNSTLDFSYVLRLNLDAMLRDNAIPSVDALFEILFREIPKRKNVLHISDVAGAKVLGQVVIESVLDALPCFFE